MINEVTWIVVLTTIGLCCSAYGNGGNDVANSYATSVGSRALKLWQVGVLATVTEFVGAVAFGSRVTGTIKSGIIDLDRFRSQPAMMVLAMGCAEFGGAAWLLTATRVGFAVSTTQTAIGALIGAGLASHADIKWGWAKGSVSQIAASWGIAPCAAAAVSAAIFATMKYLVLERKDSFPRAIRAIPFYFAFTATVLALFFTMELPISPGIRGEGALHPGVVVGIALGVFAAIFALSSFFFVPYVKLRFVRLDPRARIYHVVLGPLLNRDDPPLFWPGDENVAAAVRDYYADAGHGNASTTPESLEKGAGDGSQAGGANKHVEPEERWLEPCKHLRLTDRTRLFGMVKYYLLRGVMRDCVTHDTSGEMARVHACARRYDNRVEHLWTYAQVISAMMMSIAHGSNDVSNALGPWVGAYNTWLTGEVTDEATIPIWIVVVAGLLLGVGFWFSGYRIVRTMANDVTRMTPARGYAIEMGAAITVLAASALGLPISTTQCLTGGLMGVALMNLDHGAVRWSKLVRIFGGRRKLSICMA
ncbi:inorganic phosphate transporter, PiT family [Geosmithia morbida]|uniref:Phosphate transporter n=1 Tax=Geosmithia morbida TaxID=1094350 RepID=A0A9P5D0K1_9HYPO|nr:inorganic phosphate transporter, PiT family [Geosmithia morbida]KAF4121697.1 inorganic phosphate transporter, PiT family [Geosmithia morbida]